MRRIAALPQSVKFAVLAAVLVARCAARPSTVITAREFAVVRIIDGDTFTVMYVGEETSVRIVNFDAPEPREPGGPEATAALRKLIEGKTVTLEFTSKKKRDNFGRLLATVFVDGRDVGEAMVRNGDEERR